MTRERAAELLSEVMVLDDPEMAEAHRVAISVLRQQETVKNRNGLNEPLTNAQKIRAMTNEELAKLLCCTGWRMIEQKECLEWLQMPAGEEGKHENHT